MSFLSTYDQLPEGQKQGFLLQQLGADFAGVTAELRQNRPILTAPGTPPLVLITLFQDVEEVLSRNLVFTVRPYAPKMDPSVGPFMLARDGTVYNQRDKGILRALIQETDMPSVRAKVSGFAQAAIARGASDDGRLELVSQVTRPVPVMLTGAYFGFPGPDMITMLEWSYKTQYDMFHNLTNDPTIHQNCITAGTEMRAYLENFLPLRAKQVQSDPSLDDVVARMLRLVTPPSIGFDLNRIMTNTMGLLVGGIETTSAAIVQAIDQLLDRPTELAAAIKAAGADDPALFDAYFWEALRFNPINPFVGRLSVADYTVAAGSAHATHIPAGSFVLASTASAMLDATQLPNPTAFQIDRPPYHYMHLGVGDHVCLGDQVSRQQAPEIARQILLAGFTQRAESPAGKIDMQGGPFPESFTLIKAA